MNAYRRNQKIEYYKTLALVQATVYSGNVVAAAQSEDSSPVSVDGINKVMDELKELMIPELAEDKKKKAERAKKIMDDELSKGAFKVTARTFDKKPQRKKK